jgi:hypothetical protein
VTAVDSPAEIRAKRATPRDGGDVAFDECVVVHGARSRVVLAQLFGSAAWSVVGSVIS